jgi:hypothetical protein
MKKPWEETWIVRGTNDIEGDEYPCIEHERPEPRQVAIVATWFCGDVESARLASAAPELVRALLAVEWGADVDGGTLPGCSACYGARPDPRTDFHPSVHVDHKPNCVLDAALTKAGITPEMREVARAELAER